MEFVISTLQKNDLSPRLLDIELTEYSFLKDLNPAVDSIINLKSNKHLEEFKKIEII